MLLSGTSIVQQSRLCSRQVLTTDCLLADLCPKWTQNAVLICNLDQNCSHTLFSVKLIFSLPSLWKAPDVCENPSVTDDSSSCWKRADWSDKMLGFQTTQCGVMYRATPGSSKHGGWICWQARLWHPDMGYRGYWSTGTGKAGQMFYDFNKIWGKRALVWINRVYHPGRKMQIIWDDCSLLAPSNI